jgi:transcriptional regulator with XRE-family HTH domain
MTKEELGAKIRTIRTERGISQDALGKVLNRTHAAVSDIERGKTDLSVSDLYTIAKFFEMPITEFLEEQKPSVPSFVQYRDAKDITPKEKEAADRVANDFITLARKLAKEQKDK